jgi:hypothetical protein
MISVEGTPPNPEHVLYQFDLGEEFEGEVGIVSGEGVGGMEETQHFTFCDMGTQKCQFLV